jgi:hypothetical protein
MDPITIALTLLMKNPSDAASAVDKATAPVTVDVGRMRESFADLSTGILKCYHQRRRRRKWHGNSRMGIFPLFQAVSMT